MEKRRVVITGLGAVTPIGHTAPESWAAVRAGKCGVAPITRYNTENQKVKLAAEVKDHGRRQGGRGRQRPGPGL